MHNLEGIKAKQCLSRVIFVSYVMTQNSSSYRLRQPWAAVKFGAVIEWTPDMFVLLTEIRLKTHIDTYLSYLIEMQQ